MNQLCKVCGEPAAGFHFGAFTCEGCKSFFGRTYNNISAIAGCKNNGDCVINKKNRTACKACRLRKCLLVGMSKSGSRYGRRSNWFKIHCLLQEQQSHQGVTSPAGGDGGEASGGAGGAGGGGGGGGGIGTGTNFEQLARLHQIQARQTYQDKTNPCIKSASMSPTLSLSAASLSQQAAAVAAAAAAAAAAHQHHHQQQQQQHHQHRQHQPHHLLQHAQQELQRLPPHYLNAAKFLNGVASETKSESRRASAATPSDSWTSSAGDAADDSHSNRSSRTACGSRQSSATPLMRHFEAEKQREEQAAEEEREGGEAGIEQDRGRQQQQQQQQQPSADFCEDLHESRRRQFLHIFRSHSEPLHTFAPTKSPFAAFAIGSLQQSPLPPATPPMQQLFVPAALKTSALRNAPDEETQHEPIDLSLRTRLTSSRRSGDSRAAATAADDAEGDRLPAEMRNRDGAVARPSPLDLTLVRTPSLTG